MKRIAIICVVGIAIAFWFPGYALAGGIGVLVGWNVLEQPRVVEDWIYKIKRAVE